MTTRAWQLPFGLDPLIAEAKRRARLRRLLGGALVFGACATAIALTVGSPSGQHGGAGVASGRAAPAAPRQLSPAESRWISVIPTVPRRGGYVGVTWVSKSYPGIGLVVLYPGRWLDQARHRASQTEKVGPEATDGDIWFITPLKLPTAAKPVAAYLVRRGYGVLAQTILRGPLLNRPQLADFCRVGRRSAKLLVELVAPYCG